ncbi:YceI family protein [Nonomuraea sp. GTA35]|uniref:YceI family protein n=1 Tax=Nonomuraea sp. GTA35 TaxID=1676746 RepID=UPI0035BF2536
MKAGPSRPGQARCTRSGTGQAPYSAEQRTGTPAPLEDSSVVVEIPTGTFTSGLRMRDRHVRAAEFLDVRSHPTMSFRGGLPDQGQAPTALHGHLTVREVGRPLSLTLLSVTSTDTLLTADATATIDRYAFGLTKGRGMAARHLRIAIQIVATRDT